MAIGLPVGKKAPSFTLMDKDGKKVSLEKIRGDFTIVFFYPKDNTPGCTIEAKSLSSDLARFKKLGVSVVGISGGDAKSKAAFCKAHSLKVTLLSDPDFSVCRKYGAYGQKMFMGRKHMGIFRTTMILDKDLKVVKTYEKVTPADHSAEMQADIAAMKKGKVSTSPIKAAAPSVKRARTPVVTVTAKKKVGTSKAKSPKASKVTKPMLMPKTAARSKATKRVSRSR